MMRTPLLAMYDNYDNCDGRDCGMGRVIRGGSYLCPHNNLKVKRPDLMLEWDYEKNNEQPENLTVGSNKYAWWVCCINPCGCHKWDSKVNNRTCKNGRGCPYCSGNKICIHNSLYGTNSPILLEWDYEKNGDIKPWQIAPHTNKKYWWKCLTEHCGCHIWNASPNDRSRPGNGCPFCSGQRTCFHNSLYTIRPELAAEWDYERNGNIKPWQIAPWSGQEMHWICVKRTCECHKWQASPSNRTYKGCPYCSNKIICIHNSLYTYSSEVAAEWDYERNGDIKPWQIAPKGSTRYWWRCQANNLHRWLTTPGSRICQGTGCPHCGGSSGYSKAQIRWLKELEEVMNIKIQHAQSDEGEYKILNVGKVDGYCRGTNTVYEYHGDYWHGNPNIFHPNDFNERVKKLFGELYRQTIERENKIRSLGYNLIVKWETSIDEVLEISIDLQYFKI